MYFKEFKLSNSDCMAKPVIFVTDICEDPDDALALILALASPEIGVKLVVTSDEKDGKRAAFARALLDALGSSNIPVVRGHESIKEGSGAVIEKVFGSTGILARTKIPEEKDYVSTIRQTVKQNPGISIISVGTFVELADLARREPEIAGSVGVTLMGGALNYHKPGKAEHNVRYSISDITGIDSKPVINAAMDLFTSRMNLRFVLGDTTFMPDKIGITKDSETYKLFDGLGSTAAALVQANMDAFFEKYYKVSIMHDPLTVASMLGDSIVEFGDKKIAMGETGEMREAGNAVEGMVLRQLKVSTNANYSEFMQLFSQRISALVLKSAQNELKVLERKEEVTKVKIK